MNTELLKYKKWNNWFRLQKNKKLAYSVFSYWLRVRKESKQINVNFNLTPKFLKNSIQNQYVNIKYDKVFKSLELKYDVDLNSDTESVDYIKKKLASLAYSAKELNYMLNQLLKRNLSYLPNVLLSIKNKIDYINLFYKNTKEINLLKHFDKNNIEYDFHENKDLKIYIVKSNKDNIDILSSPSWCLIYDQSHIETYFKNYKEIQISYLFNKKTKEFSMYGFNISSLNNVNYVEEVINMYNVQSLNDETIYLSKILRRGLDFNEIFKEKNDLLKTIKAALNEVKSEEFLLGFLLGTIKKASDINQIVEELSARQCYAILKRLLYVLKDESIYEEWVINGVQALAHKISNIEKVLIYEYVLNSNKVSIIESLMVNKIEILPRKYFKYLYQKNKMIALKSLDAFYYIDIIDKEDYKYLLDNEIILTNKNINFLIKNMKDDNLYKTVDMLNEIVGDKLAIHLTYNLYSRFSLEDREKLLLDNEFSMNSVLFLNNDQYLDSNRIISHHIYKGNLDMEVFINLNENLFNKHFYDYNEYYKNSNFKKLKYRSIPEDKITNLYIIRRYLDLESEHIIQMLVKSIIDDGEEKIRKLLLEAETVSARDLLLTTIMNYNTYNFQGLYKVANHMGIKFLLDFWIKIYDTFPLGCVLETASNSELLGVLFDRKFLYNFADISEVDLILNKTETLKKQPEKYILYIKNLKDLESKINYGGLEYKKRVKSIKCNLRSNFIAKYGVFKYLHLSLRVKLYLEDRTSRFI